MTDVECCVNNLDSETWRTLTTNPRVSQQHCLRRCGVCHDRPFLVVDGDVVVGADHATLLRSVDGATTADGDGATTADGDGATTADGDGGEES